MRDLNKYGSSLIGKKAQSILLTRLNDKGRMVHEEPQEITGYEIVQMFMEDTLMVFIGGTSVFEDTLFNIH